MTQDPSSNAVTEAVLNALMETFRVWFPEEEDARHAGWVFAAATFAARIGRRAKFTKVDFLKLMALAWDAQSGRKPS